MNDYVVSTTDQQRCRFQDAFRADYVINANDSCRLTHSEMNHGLNWHYLVTNNALIRLNRIYTS